MDELRALIDSTPIADTHEHLLEEKARLAGGNGYALDDIGVFFSHYLNDELRVAGMPADEAQALLMRQTPPDEKWRLLWPWWKYVRASGYARGVRESVRLLFGEPDLDDTNWQRVQQGLRALIRPGYYNRVLREVANVDHSQVHSLEHPFFMDSAQPDLLLQDLLFMPLSTDPRPDLLAQHSGMTIRTLDDFLAAVDWAFATWGPRAIAMKNHNAYLRGLDFAQPTIDEARAVFDRWAAAGYKADPASRKPLEDFLFHYCLGKSVSYALPVKLHTGFYAGHGYMPLHRLARNAGDLCELARLHPRTRFVFMHITYPYQHEALAIAKHYPNVWIDMSWAWVINPAACVRFLREAILSVPWNKILAFGGDFGPVELVPGHAAIARQGIHQALSELHAEGWLAARDVEPIALGLLRNNALALFDVERARRGSALS